MKRMAFCMMGILALGVGGSARAGVLEILGSSQEESSVPVVDPDLEPGDQFPGLINTGKTTSGYLQVTCKRQMKRATYRLAQGDKRFGFENCSIAASVAYNGSSVQYSPVGNERSVNLMYDAYSAPAESYYKSRDFEDHVQTILSFIMGAKAVTADDTSLSLSMLIYLAPNTLEGDLSLSQIFGNPNSSISLRNARFDHMSIEFFDP